MGYKIMPDGSLAEVDDVAGIDYSALMGLDKSNVSGFSDTGLYGLARTATPYSTAYFQDAMGLELPEDTATTLAGAAKGADFSTGFDLDKLLGMEDGKLFGMNNDQIGGLSTLGGLAMKAIALPSQMDYYNAQKDLLKQQLASNQESMENRRTFNKNWANASNNLGLAQSTRVG